MSAKVLARLSAGHERRYGVVLHMCHACTTECVILTSSAVSIAEQKNQIQQLLQILNGNRILYTAIDCSDEGNKELRDFYFEKSGIRANYPQVFLVSDDGPQTAKYIGSFTEIQQLNEMSDVPKEILEANNTPTLDSVFAGVARKP